MSFICHLSEVGVDTLACPCSEVALFFPENVLTVDDWLHLCCPHFPEIQHSLSLTSWYYQAIMAEKVQDPPGDLHV